MTQEDLAIWFAVLGATYLVTALISRYTGDARRDTWLMTGLGTALGVIAAALGVSAAWE